MRGEFTWFGGDLGVRVREVGAVRAAEGFGEDCKVSWSLPDEGKDTGDGQKWTCSGKFGKKRSGNILIREREGSVMLFPFWLSR